MTVRFSIPAPLRPLSGGRALVDVASAAGTLQSALAALFAVHPALRDRVLTERGEVREHVNVFVGNRESRSTGGLATRIADGTEISIIPAISGG